MGVGAGDVAFTEKCTVVALVLPMMSSMKTTTVWFPFASPVRVAFVDRLRGVLFVPPLRAYHQEKASASGDATARGTSRTV